MKAANIAFALGAKINRHINFTIRFTAFEHIVKGASDLKSLRAAAASSGKKRPSRSDKRRDYCQASHLS
jgi:hypothetical protein